MMHLSGSCAACSSAPSRSGLYGMTRPASMPHDADTIRRGLASSMRAASSFEAKPPNTTECTAPMRAQPSMAISASGTIGM